METDTKADKTRNIQNFVQRFCIWDDTYYSLGLNVLDIEA